jgi:hypothetical protein
MIVLLRRFGAKVTVNRTRHIVESLQVNFAEFQAEVSQRLVAAIQPRGSQQFTVAEESGMFSLEHKAKLRWGVLAYLATNSIRAGILWPVLARTVTAIKDAIAVR